MSGRQAGKEGVVHGQAHARTARGGGSGSGRQMQTPRPRTALGGAAAHLWYVLGFRRFNHSGGVETCDERGMGLAAQASGEGRPPARSRQRPRGSVWGCLRAPE